MSTVIFNTFNNHSHHCMADLFHLRNMISLLKVWMLTVTDIVDSPAFTKLN